MANIANLGLFGPTTRAVGAPAVEEEGGVGGTLLSGLATVGRFLDINTGAAFLRNVLGGEFGQALKTLPGLGMFTAPESSYAVSGKELVENLGIPDVSLSDVAPFLFGEPGSGSLIERGGFFDFTAQGTAGFATEMILDPATYVGIGALTRTGKALSILGKTPDKVARVFRKAAIEGVESLPKVQQAAFNIVKDLPEGQRFLLPTLAEQAANGQRSLLSRNIPFARLSGQRLPIPFIDVDREVKIFQALSGVGRAVRAGPFGKLFLNRPGSSTGFDNHNDMAKLLVNRIKGKTRLETEEAEKIVMEIQQIVKATESGVDKNPELLAKRFEEIVGAWEMTDNYKALPEAERAVTDQLRAKSDELLQRDISAGSNTSNLGDSLKARTAELETKVNVLREKGLNEQADLSIQAMAQEQRKITTAEEAVRREQNFIMHGVERELGRNVLRLEKQADRIVDSVEGINLAATGGKAPLKNLPTNMVQTVGRVKALDQTIKRLDTQYAQAQRRWINAAERADAPGRFRPLRLQKADNELRAIERATSRQRDLLLQTQARLVRQGRKAEAVTLGQASRLLTQAEASQVALEKIRKNKLRIEDLDVLEEIPKDIMHNARKRAADRTAAFRKQIRYSNARVAKIDRVIQRMLLEFDPNQLDIPKQLQDELLKEFPLKGAGTVTARLPTKIPRNQKALLKKAGKTTKEIREMSPQQAHDFLVSKKLIEPIVPDFKLPRILNEVSKSTARTNQLGALMKAEILDLSAKAPQTDYYAAHIITQPAKEYLEKMFPTRFKGASRVWTQNHGSTLKRMIPFDINTVNEKLRNAIGGGDFFETNPGVIQFTRAMRTVRSEAFADYARGLTQLEGTARPAEEMIVDIATKGDARRVLSPQELARGVDPTITPNDINKLSERIYGSVDEATGSIRRASDKSYMDGLEELDSILAASDSEFRLPQDRQIWQTWKNLDINPVVVPTEIANDTALFGKVAGSDPEVLGTIGRVWAAATRPWKQFTLFFWPSYYSRNFFSEHFLNVVEGMTNPGRYYTHSTNALWLNMMEIKLGKAQRLAKQADISSTAGAAKDSTKHWAEYRRVLNELQNRKFNTQFGEVTGEEILEQYARNGLDDGYNAKFGAELLNPADQFRQDAEVVKELRQAAARPVSVSNMGDLAKGISRNIGPRMRGVQQKFDRLVNKISGIGNTWSEKHPRMTQFLWELEDNGRQFQDAALQVVKRHYDYNSLAFTAFENKLSSTAIPFYRWMRSNTPEMAKQFLGTPRRTTAVIRLSENQFGEEERKALPPWIRESVKVRLSNNQVIHRVGLPFEDLLEWFNDPRRKIVTSVHPVGQEFLRQTFGIDPFTGKPPQPFLGPQGPALPGPLESIGRTALGRVQSTLRRAGEVSSGQLDLSSLIAAETTGLRPRPFDPKKAQLQQAQEKVQQLVKEGRIKQTEIPFLPADADDPEAQAALEELQKLRGTGGRRRGRRRRRRRTRQ